MNDNTILRIKVPANLYESVKEQLTVSEAPKEMSHGLLQKMLDDLLVKYGNTDQMKSDILVALRGKINDMLNDMHSQLKTKFREEETVNEAKKAGHNLGAGMELVKEKKMKAPKDGMKKVEEINNIEETDNKMEMKTRTLDELKAAKDKLEKKIQEMQGKDEANKMDEAEIGSLMDPNFIAGLATLLGVGGTLVTALVKDLKKAKSPEEKKAVFAKASDSIETAMGK